MRVIRGSYIEATIAGGSVKSYGVWLEEFFAYLIVEMKNEPAGLGGDQFLQGLIVYNRTLPRVEDTVFLIPTKVNGDKQMYRVASQNI